MPSMDRSVGISGLQAGEDVKKDGHPGHPLYLPARLRPQPWVVTC